MENKLRYIHVFACSNLGTRIQLTLSSETDDLRGLISDALFKLSQYCTRDEQFKIEHIDSVSRFQDPKI
nr:MAG TPA: hypothetical protein [Microviridae sp.]